jgi:hypothetical protein
MEGAIRFAKQAEQAILAGDMAGRQDDRQGPGDHDELQSTLINPKRRTSPATLIASTILTRDRLCAPI